MFQLNPSPTFKVKLTLPQPGDGPGVTVTVEYRHLSIDKMRETLMGETEAQILNKIIAAWDGASEPWGPEVAEKLLTNHVRAAKVLIERYKDELLGARLGN